jgi:hypothetical protein
MADQDDKISPWVHGDGNYCRIAIDIACLVRGKRFNADKYLISCGHARTGLGEEVAIPGAIYKPDEILAVEDSCDASNGFEFFVPRNEIFADGERSCASASISLGIRTDDRCKYDA